MVFTYADDKAPSRATAYAILNMLDPAKKLNPLFVEMKLNNFNFETIGAKLSRTAQAVNHWFLEDGDCSLNAIQVRKCNGRDSGARAGGEGEGVVEIRITKKAISKSFNRFKYFVSI